MLFISEHKSALETDYVSGKTQQSFNYGSETNFQVGLTRRRLGRCPGARGFPI